MVRIFVEMVECEGQAVRKPKKKTQRSGSLLSGVHLQKISGRAKVCRSPRTELCARGHDHSPCKPLQSEK